MGSGSSMSNKQQKSTDTANPRNMAQSQTKHKNSAIFYDNDSNTKPKSGSQELMARPGVDTARVSPAGQKNTKIHSHDGQHVGDTTSHPDKAVTEKPGVHKNTIIVGNPTEKRGDHKNTLSADISEIKKNDRNPDLEVGKEFKKSPKGQQRKAASISKISTEFKRLDATSLHEKERLMEWLEAKMKSLNAEVLPDTNYRTAQVQVHGDDDDEGKRQQHTDEDWTNTKKEIVYYKKEKHNLLNIVSEIAGARLKNNNPAIADLSDKNRASKLAERFSELYDNEWTDVVEVLRTTGKGKRTKNEEEELEEKCIHYMVDIVKVTYEHCQKKARDDLDKMIDIVVKSTTPSTDVEKKCKDFMKSQMSSREESLKKVVKLVGKQVDERIGEMAKYAEFYKHPNVSKYYIRYRDNCVELCWYMCLQDPPVAMMATSTPKATKDHFRAYTRSGKHLDFVVWPALFLHEDGPLLYKGVAQCTDTPQEESEHF